MSRGTQVPRTIEEHGPSPIARWGPMVAILASLALVAAVVVFVDPIDGTQAAPTVTSTA